MKIVYLITGLLLTSFTVYSQQGIQSPTGPPKLLPTPPSPQAASLGKFGTIPVGHRTGIPDVSIPITNISVGGYNLPISVSYHSLGNKLDEVSSNVGLGWTLIANGAITHSDKGNITPLPADNWAVPPPLGQDPCVYYNHPPIQYEHAKQWLEQNLNFETPVYSYNIPGNSGKFFIKELSDVQINDGGQLVTAQQGVTIPASNLKIYLTPGKFIIIDATGTRFLFAKTESSSMSQSCQPSTLSPTVYPGTNTSFLLTRIELVGGETIEFGYEQESYSYLDSRSQNMLVPYENNYNCGELITLNNLQECTTTMGVYGWRLMNVEASNGQRVTFTYSSRKDIYGAGKLDKVSVFNNDKTGEFRFLNSYFGTIANNEAQDELYSKLRLDAIQEYSADGVVNKPPYQFSYEDGIVTPRVYGSKDFYGYGNGGTSSTWPTSIIPSQPDINYSGANRNPGFSFGAVAGALKKVIFPTQGYTSFEYEGEATGGIRLKRQTDYDYNDAIINRRSYSYNRSTTPDAAYLLQTFRSTITMFRPDPDYQISYTNICSFYSLTSDQQMQDVLPTGRSFGVVDEIMEDGNGNFGGKTTYEYGPPVTISSNSIFYPIIVQENPGVYLTDRSFLQEQLSKKTIWKYSNSQWVPINKTEYEYEIQGGNESTLKNFRLSTIESEIYYYHSIIYYFCRPATFHVQRWQYASTWYRLKQSTETQYDETGNPSSVIETNFVDFDNTSLQPKKLSWSSSAGEAVELAYRFPSDFATISPYSDMIARNIVSPVIGERQVVNNVLASETVTQYSATGNRFLPTTVYYFDRGTSTHLASSVVWSNPSTLDPALFKPAITNVEYNVAGLLTKHRSEDGKYTTVKWGYQNQFPTAICESSAGLDFFYTSFEQPTENGVLPSGVPKARTGKKAFFGSSFNTSFSPANPSLYVVNFWYSTAQNIWKFSGNLPFTSSTISMPGALYIDEVRIAPKSSSVSTFTYDYASGTTSITDTNNLTTYYEYDALNRLSALLNNRNHLVSRIFYNYRR